MADKGFPASPAVLDTPPVADDFGTVVRVLGPIGPIVGPIDVKDVPASVAVVTVVPVSFVEVVLAAANPGRRTARFHNRSDKRLFLKLGVGVTTLNYTEVLFPGDSFALDLPGFTGVVTGIWEAGAVGAALITDTT